MFIKIGDRIVNTDRITIAEFTAAGTYGEQTNKLVLYFGDSDDTKQPQESRFHGDEAATLWAALTAECQ
jgi:hypothetical protein